MLRCMTAEPIRPPADPGRSPAAIRDLLPALDRAEFARRWAAALEEARRNWTIQPVDEVLEQWRRIALLSRLPGHGRALEHARALLDGDDAPTFPADLDALLA